VSHVVNLEVATLSNLVSWQSIFTGGVAIALLAYVNNKFSQRANGTPPKRSDDWITGLWMLSTMFSLACTALFGMTNLGYTWSLRAQAGWLDFSTHTRNRLDRWEKSNWHWTCMFWYCVILDVMFASAHLTLFLGLIVFVRAEEKAALAALATAVAVIVAIQWGFRIFMVFTCLWKFELYPTSPPSIPPVQPEVVYPQQMVQYPFIPQLQPGGVYPQQMIQYPPFIPQVQPGGTYPQQIVQNPYNNIFRSRGAIGGMG